MHLSKGKGIRKGKKKTVGIAGETRIDRKWQRKKKNESYWDECWKKRESREREKENSHEPIAHDTSEGTSLKTRRKYARNCVC